ncbi:DNA-binding transcriptional LysR family regulator [Lactobacillus colini]|uniref:DNA-binding transcriptional LysR family regulator n=1 Tax=Lactobacillus colini TaxID=1819254 RepID=A0ABS4MEZ2_9LACO|nr:LysR family transcriptional regulator [Lactobacillus colini]MBP2058214.1 DNA-binding transcriptional LysR family regulator [Lactobacillus colini]
MYNHEIDTFIDVTKTGSFSKTAKNLYISKAAVAQQISNLEKKLGVLLFDRTTHGVRLTKAGHYFLIRSKELVNLAQEITHGLAAYQSYLVIGAGYLNKQELIPEILKNKEIAKNDIRFQEIVDYNHIPSSIDIIEMIKSKEPIGKQGFTFIKAKKVPYVLAVPNTSSLVSKKIITLSDLANKTVDIPAENITGDSRLKTELQSLNCHINIQEYKILNRAQINKSQYNGDYLLIPEPLANLSTPYLIKTLDSDLYVEYGFYVKSSNINLISKVKSIYKARSI